MAAERITLLARTQTPAGGNHYSDIVTVGGAVDTVSDDVRASIALQSESETALLVLTVTRKVAENEGFQYFRWRERVWRVAGRVYEGRRLVRVTGEAVR